MQTIGIVGASGYSGEVLLEILSKHPNVRELIVASRSHVGKRVDTVLPRLGGLVGDMEFVEADCEIEGDCVIVSSNAIDTPVAVRYGWGNDALPTLLNKEGLPASPFRTDVWKE